MAVGVTDHMRSVADAICDSAPNAVLKCAIPDDNYTVRQILALGIVFISEKWYDVF